MAPTIEGIQWIGSYENHLYIKSQSNEGSKIHYYNGQELIELEFSFSINGIADIAVDKNGIAWYPLSTYIDGQTKIDTILSIDVENSIMKKYPLGDKICGFGAYGTTIINDTLLIGFGENNIDFPNQIIGINIENDKAELTNKVIHTEFKISDLASNNSGNSTVPINEIIKSMEFKIYPNPVRNYTLIKRDNPKQGHLTLFSLSGNLLLQKEVSESIFQLDLNSLPSGNYYIKIDGVTKKVIKN